MTLIMRDFGSGGVWMGGVLVAGRVPLCVGWPKKHLFVMLS